MTRPVTQITLVISLLGDVLISIILLFIGLAGGNPTLVAVALFTIGGIMEKPGILTGYRIKKHPAVHGIGCKYAGILRFLSGLFLIVTGFLLMTEILRLLADGYMITVEMVILFAVFLVLFLKSILHCNTLFAAQRTKSRFLYTEVSLQRNGLLILAVACAAVTAGRLGYPAIHGLATLSISVLVIRLGIGLVSGGRFR